GVQLGDVKIGIRSTSLAPWKRIDHIGDRGHGARPRGGAGNGPDQVDPRALAQPFVIGEEEHLVLDDRAADRYAELVQPKRGLRSRIKKVARIEGVVAQVFE